MCIDDDSIFVPYGDSVLGYQGIDVIDINKGKVVKNIDLNNTRVSEPEAVFFYQGEIFIADQATTIKHIIKFINNNDFSGKENLCYTAIGL